MDYSIILKDARASHDVVYELLGSWFEHADEEEKKRFQDDVRRLYLPFDLKLSLCLLKSALLYHRDRRSHVHFLVKYGQFTFDILHFASSYIDKKGLDLPCDEKALRSMSDKDAERLIEIIQEPINHLFEPVTDFFHGIAWDDKGDEKKRMEDAVLGIGNAFLQAGKGSEDEEVRRLNLSLKDTLINPLN